MVIELARGKGENPEVPDWMQSDYDLAVKDIAQYGLENLNEEWDTETLQSVLGPVAILKGARDLVELIFEIDADDAKELLDKYFDLRRKSRVVEELARLCRRKIPVIAGRMQACAASWRRSSG